MRRICNLLLLGPVLGSLAACGGGGGGGSNLASTPPPPPPSAPVNIFPSITQSTEFATLGYEAAGVPISIGSLNETGFSVTYDATANAYVMNLPSSAPGVFEAYQTGDRYWNGQLQSTSGSQQPFYLDVFRPGPQNWDFPGLTYTSFATYGGSTLAGTMAFGVATATSAIPVTGSATYNAFAAGYLDTGSEALAIRGSVIMEFDFGAGSLAGSFDPYVYDLLAGHTPLGHYEFVNTVFGVGSTTFSGELSRAGVAQSGTFNGLFTGPNAQELMARWTAPLPNPDTNTISQMFGVWVGKCC